MFIILLIAIVNLLLGFLVLFQNTKIIVNRIFFIMVISAVLWMLSSYFTDTAPVDTRLIWAKLAFVFPIITVCSFALFAKLFPSKIILAIDDAKYIITAGMIGTVLVMTDSVVSGIVITSSSTIIQPGLLYLPYILFVSSTLLIGMRALFLNVKEGELRQLAQVRLIVVGFTVAFVWVLLANVLFPLLWESVDTPKFGPIGTVIFIAATAYAMVRHGLFDIRLAAVRSITYILSLLVLAGTYYAVAYLVSVAFFQGEVSSSFSLSPLNILLALALAFIFQPIKRFFDKTTDKIFFRDRYDPEDFYARLNEILASTTDLRNLLRRASSEVASTLKAERALFYVQYDHAYHVSAGTKGSGTLPRVESLELDEYIKNRGDGVIIESLLPGGDSIKRLMISHNLSVILPLTQKKKPLGYLLLGQQMGGTYNSRDIRVLETIVDSLVVAIENSLSVQEVKDLNENLQQRIEKATEELRLTNARLRRLDTAKDEFLSIASHQLRTPLTSIKGYLSMMLEGDTGKLTNTQKKVVSEAFSSSERMVHLIHDFLNVSRIQTGKFILELNQIDLALLVAEEVDSLEKVAQTRGLSIEFHDRTQSLPLINLDNTKIRQVVMNYIDNAIFYSRPDSTVVVELSNTMKQVTLKVTDTGIGVPKNEQARLFSKFYRASNARKHRPDGTGVGIYLAKRVIEALGGRVIFSSKEGTGSTFGFSLPLKTNK